MKAFVRHYVETGCGKKAILAIGYTGKHPYSLASKLIYKPKIKQAIIEFEESMQEQVRQRVYAAIHRVELIAQFDPRDLVDHEGRPHSLNNLPANAAAAIQGVEIEEYIDKSGNFCREFKYRAASKLDANKVILQYQRVLVQSHELSGPNGGPIPVARSADDLNDEQLAAIASAGRPTSTEPEKGEN